MSDGRNGRGSDDLSARIEAAKAALEKEPPSGQVATKYNALSLAWRMVLELVVGAVIGAAIGWGLDRLVGLAPLFMIVFGLLGFAAGAKTAIGTARDVGRRSSGDTPGKNAPGGSAAKDG